MKKWMALFCVLVIGVLLVCSGCVEDKPTENGDPTTTVTPTCIDEPYTLSHALMIKIAETCFTTLYSTGFEEGETVPFENLMTYYSREGCFTFDERMIDPAILPYYDEESMIFSIPREKVDTFLTQRFNTAPAPEKVECYNRDTDCYDIPRFNQDFHYDTVIETYRALGNNRYEFKAKFTHASGTFYYSATYTVELTYEGYKILAHRCSDMIMTDSSETEIVS